ncbi:MAG TPA: hypothetical protein VMY37_02355 [Thermoguttaceae bacterium]|nr:hypothetical protein [Thermoguttaceae bacterium]
MPKKAPKGHRKMKALLKQIAQVPKEAIDQPKPSKGKGKAKRKKK